MIVTGGATDITTYFSMRLLTTGAGATGLTISDFDLQYVRTRTAPVAKVDAVALAATDTAHTDNRGIEIDATDQPGLYRFDWPDAAFAAGVKEVILSVKHASCFTEHLRVEIDPFGAAAGASLAADIAAVKSQTAAIETDTQDIQGRLPAALVSGRIDASVGAMAAGTVTAAAIATGAVDADAIAADAVTEIQAGLATAAALDTVDNFLDTEIAAILAAVDTEIGTIVTAVAAIETDTQDIQGRLPAALVSGRIDASVGAMAANVMTAAAAAADLTTELQSGLSTLDAAGVRTAVGLASANLDTQLSTIDNFIDTEIASLVTDVATILAAVDTEVAAIKAKTDLIPGSQDGKTFAETILLMACVLLGKSSGMATATNIFRALNDSKDRVTATTDADGNRSALTLDAS